jgi:hypothetical protein
MSGPAVVFEHTQAPGGHEWGAAFETSVVSATGPTQIQNSCIHNSEHEPPTAAACEQCGGPFDRRHPHPRMSPKRFCSERCRRAAENVRAQLRRKQHG